MYICCFGTYRGDGVEGSVSTDAEVRARNIVGDSGGDNNHGNTHLLVFLSGLNQLQASNISLEVEEKIETSASFGKGGSDFEDGLSGESSRLTAYLKSTNDHQSMDVELGNVLTDFLQHLSRQSSLDAQIVDSKKGAVLQQKLEENSFTFWCPTLSLLFQSTH